MKNGRSGLSLVAMSGRLYAMGSYVGDSYYPSALAKMYDPIKVEWTLMLQGLKKRGHLHLHSLFILE